MKDIPRGVCGIYSLSCPKTGKVRYIGQSKDIRERYSSHLHSNAKYPVSNWIRKLKSEGLRPELSVISECREEDLDSEELSEIAKHGEGLLNLTQGGKPGYEGMAAHKPWFVKGMSHPSKLFILQMRNRGVNSDVVELVKKQVSECKNDKERSLLELWYAYCLSETPLRDKVNKWADIAGPKMIEKGYV